MMTGWDATELAKWQLQDGSSIEQVYQELTFALSALNGELMSGLWGSMISFQDRPEVEYRVGASNGFEAHTEYGRPDAKRADTEGHMLPFIKYDRALGWTYDYLEEARMEQLQADIADGIKDARDIWRQKILGRVLQQGDDSGTAKGLGSSGYSPGFATAAGSTNVDFTPPAYGGSSFSSSHEHYVAIAGGVYTNAVFSDAKSELREHGHEPPYMFIAGPSDETTIKGLTDFTPIAESLVRSGNTQDVAMLPAQALTMGAYPIGTIHEFAVYIVAGMPQYYGFGWKSYGNLSQRNPLRIRVKKGMGSVAVTAANDPRNGSPAHPLQYLMLNVGFGVGVYDRTNGTARYVNNAAWSDGTAT
jgi:hypothetical protein